MYDPFRHERKIVIIEDEPAHAEALMRFLSESDYQCSVKIAGSLQEFNLLLSSYTPDLVIADINLPDGSAFSILKSEMDDQPWPVLIMTSHGDEEMAVKAIKSGALDYIVKSSEAFRNIEHVVRRNLREWRNIQLSRENERKFRILFETMEQGVIYLDSKGKIIAANPSAEKITGMTLAGMKGGDFFSPASWSVVNEDASEYPFQGHAALKSLETGKPCTGKIMSFRKSPGEVLVWLLVSAIPQFRGNESTPYQMFITFTDITAMKQTELDLQNAKKKAEESDRLKSVFMANMSHEIRTPMNGILGFADLLKTPELSGESQKLYIDAIAASGKRMLDIINDLIDISRIEAGQTEIKKEITNIPALLKELMQFFAPEASRKDITLEQNVRLSAGFTIETDRTKLAQIITNLLKNSLKFTSQGGLIELSCRQEDKYKLIFSVRDNGMGIRKELQTKIFERFRQGDRADEHEGVGLGLAISKAYVEMLGGEIGIESEPGKGATFFFWLPMSEKTRVITENERKEIGSSTPRLNILVAEDDELSYFLLSEILKRNNIRPIHATDGREALDLVKSDNSIDLVLMDIKLPGMNGLDATREIKKIKPYLPVIAQSAYVSQEDIQKSLEAGCDDYISKPVDIRLLLSKISVYGKQIPVKHD